MSKRKGVSAEEKRIRMLQLFYERKEFFQLKELEKIAPKEKGIIVNSVKEVVQNLVDDGLIDTDKIGTSVYFWAFPSKAVETRKRKLHDLTENLERSSKQLKVVTDSIAELKTGREDTIERNKLLDEVVELQIEKDELCGELKKYEENDPDVLRKIENTTKEIKNAANRWTDNIFAIKSWCKNKFCYEDQMLDKQFGIPTDFDYIA